MDVFVMATSQRLSRENSTASEACDRNFFLVYVLLIWTVTIAGFGLEMNARFAEGTLHYPLIVHAHAVTFIAWLVLLSTQIALIRGGHYALHRRLGLAAVAMIPLMAILATATVIVTKTMKYGNPDTRFPFMSVQFTNVLASTVLFIVGVWLRRSPSTHKRLMLMGTLVLTEPGIRRIVSYWLNGNFDDGFFPFTVETYGGSIALMLGVGVYDLITKSRLHTAYVLAFAWCLVNQMTATWLFYQPWWSEYSGHLVGH